MWLFTIDSRWWFIAVYMQLFILAPLLNVFAEHASKSQFRYVLAVLVFSCVWMGFLRHGNICIDGKNIVNFIFIYLMGRYLRLHGEGMPRRLSTWKLPLLAYVALMAAVASMVLLLPEKWSIITMQMFYCYNSPGIYLASLLFFLLFLSLRFQSKAVNHLATSTFAIYLIHGSSDIDTWLYGRALDAAQGNLLFHAAYAVFVCLLCIAIDKVRGLLARPVVALCDKHLPFYKR